jgi:phospholipid/cholesterol/gamma-HCH transport system substrate-binding protein
MSQERKNVEFLVGLFLLIGFTVVAGLVVKFGRVGQGLNVYTLRVEFPNASGLVKDSYVLLAGARIGFVAAEPVLTERSSVIVSVKVRNEVKIPRKSTLLVGSSGLMGDRYIDVIPSPNGDPNDYALPDELIQGSRATGLDDLTVKGGAVMDHLVSDLEQIKTLTQSINQRLLNEKNLKNFEDTLGNLKATSDSLAQSARQIEPVLAEAQKTATAARTLIDSGKQMVDSGKQMVESGKAVLKKAQDGHGPLGTLISDHEAADDLKAFLSNLRRSGPVFYKDRSPTPAPRN